MHCLDDHLFYFEATTLNKKPQKRENMCELFKSNKSPLKKILAQTWNSLYLQFSESKSFRQF